MTDRDALLAAVLAAPQDDLPRLVLADWLDDNGGEQWAALIRVQIAWPGASGEEPNRATLPAECELVRVVWTRHLPPNWRATAERAVFAGMAPPAALYARGFVAAVRLTRKQFMRQAGRVFAGHPVERVELVDAVPSQPTRGWLLSRRTTGATEPGWAGQLGSGPSGLDPLIYDRLPR